VAFGLVGGVRGVAEIFWMNSCMLSECGRMGEMV